MTFEAGQAVARRSGGTSTVAAFHRNLVTMAALVVLIVCAGIAPLLVSGYLLQLATDTLMFVALAYSWNIISGCTGYLSFGQVSFFGIGAYATSVLVIRAGLPWYVAAPIASILAGVIAALLGTVMLRLRGIMFALGMLGLSRILMVLSGNWDFIGAAAGLTLPAELTPVAVYIAMWVVVIAAFGLNTFVLNSGWGLSVIGVRDDEVAAAAVGVPTARIKITAFIMSALAPAAVGGLVAWNRSFIDPASAFDPTLDLQVIVFALFGGIGTTWGPALGTVLLMVVGEQFWAYLPDLQLALYGGLVIAVVLAFPGGIVGLANRVGWLRRSPVLAPEKFPAVARAPHLAPAVDETIIDVRDLTVRFGGLVALDGISLSIHRGEMVSIIGANGAGKTTLFNAITGFIMPSEGGVFYLGKPVADIPTHERARQGIARTFQIPRLMETLTVWENTLLAARHGKRADNAVEQAAWALDAVKMDELWLEPTTKLSPGQQRRLEMARALALNPTVILLDEVMAGMTRDEQGEIRAVLRQFREYGIAGVAGVEHVISAIADIYDRKIVLDHGRKIAEGPPDVVLRDPLVIESYLGKVL